MTAWGRAPFQLPIFWGAAFRGAGGAVYGGAIYGYAGGAGGAGGGATSSTIRRRRCTLFSLDLIIVFGTHLGGLFVGLGDTPGGQFTRGKPWFFR